MKALQPLLHRQMRSLFDAEMQLNLVLPRMIENSSARPLREGLQQIFGDTRKNIQQIQDVCSLLGTAPTGVVCRTMQDLVREVSLATDAGQDPDSTDASLIASTQTIVHYQIACLDVAQQLARTLGHDSAARVLENLSIRTGQHEQLLTQIALAAVN